MCEGQGSHAILYRKVQCERHMQGEGSQFCTPHTATTDCVHPSPDHQNMEDFLRCAREKRSASHLQSMLIMDIKRIHTLLVSTQLIQNESLRKIGRTHPFHSLPARGADTCRRYCGKEAHDI